MKQEQQRVAVGPGNAHFTFIRQVSSDATTLRRWTCRHCCMAAAAAAAAAAAVYKQFDDKEMDLTWKSDTMRRHGAILENIVINLYAKFDDDRLWNEKALVLTTRTRTMLVALGDPFPGPKTRQWLWTRWYKRVGLMAIIQLWESDRICHGRNSWSYFSGLRCRWVSTGRRSTICDVLASTRRTGPTDRQTDGR